MRFAIIFSSTFAVALAHLRTPATSQARNLRLQVTVEENGNILGIEHGQRSFSGQKNAQGAYDLTIAMGEGKVVHAITSPQDQVIQIRKLGSSKENVFDDTDRAFLQDAAKAIESHPALDTASVDTLPGQASRLAYLMRDWPSSLEIDYIFDLDEETKHVEQLAEEDRNRAPVPKDAPTVPKRRHLQIVVNENGNRRLAYTSLCNQLYSWVEATHDDWSYDRGEDETTYWAYIGPFSDGPCDDGTWFWNNNQWQCYEPNHDPNIEYAYGGCFGRCGGGCGSNSQYTKDCLDHDSCVRFGHSLASFWCNDEFSSTIDDALFAPNCL